MMDNNKVFPYYQRKKPLDQDRVVCDPADTARAPAASGMKLWPLFTVFAFLGLVACCLLR